MTEPLPQVPEEAKVLPGVCERCGKGPLRWCVNGVCFPCWEKERRGKSAPEDQASDRRET
jgi:hypothetical protein